MSALFHAPAITAIRPNPALYEPVRCQFGCQFWGAIGKTPPLRTGPRYWAFQCGTCGCQVFRPCSWGNSTACPQAPQLAARPSPKESPDRSGAQARLERCKSESFVARRREMKSCTQVLVVVIPIPAKKDSGTNHHQWASTNALYSSTRPSLGRQCQQVSTSSRIRAKESLTEKSPAGAGLISSLLSFSQAIYQAG